MPRRLESVFQGENIFENFWKIFFLKIFGQFDAEHQSGADPNCYHYTYISIKFEISRKKIHQKVQRDIFIYNVEKFKLIFL